jgi:hypothetical protein
MSTSPPTPMSSLPLTPQVPFDGDPGKEEEKYIETLHEGHRVEKEEIELFPGDLEHLAMNRVDDVPEDEPYNPGEEHRADCDEKTSDENAGNGIQRFDSFVRESITH